MGIFTSIPGGVLRIKGAVQPDAGPKDTGYSGGIDGTIIHQPDSRLWIALGPSGFTYA